MATSPLPSDSEGEPCPESALELFLRWQAGEDCLGSLAARIQGWLRNAARRAMTRCGLARAVQDSQDLAQDMMITILTRLRRTRYAPVSEGQFKGLLTRIIENDVYSRRRQQRRQGIEHVESVFDSENPISGYDADLAGVRAGPTPPSAADAAIERDVVWLAISLLDETMQFVIVAGEIEGRPWKEVGEQLGITEAAAYMRSKTAKAKLTLMVHRIRSGLALDLPDPDLPDGDGS